MGLSCVSLGDLSGQHALFPHRLGTDSFRYHDPSLETHEEAEKLTGLLARYS
jgi:hypothetical protein